MGVPQEDRKKLFDWSNQMVGDQDPEFATNDAISASVELIMYGMQMAAERTKNPGDDLVSKLLQADVEGHKLSDDEFGFFVILLAVAGNETTRNSITQGMMAFADHPRPVGVVQAGAPGHRSRRGRSVGHAGDVVPADRAGRRRTGRCADQEGPAGGDVLPLGEL